MHSRPCVRDRDMALVEVAVAMVEEEEATVAVDTWAVAEAVDTWAVAAVEAVVVMAAEDTAVDEEEEGALEAVGVTKKKSKTRFLVSCG